MMTTETEPSAEQLQQAITAYRNATEYAWREVQHMRRGRVFMAWAALALTAAAAASLFVAETAQQVVFGILQMLLWCGVTWLNLSGPKPQKPPAE